jgi:dienelactone hydrolase
LAIVATTLAIAADPRPAFLRMIDRERVPLAAQESPTTVQGDRAAWAFSYASDAEQRVPGIGIRPAKPGKLPVVIVLHGTGGTKEGQVPVLRQLAKAGFAAVAIDGRYHGARTKAGGGSLEYQQAMLRTFRTGKEHPFLYDTVWDAMRLIDYLATTDWADTARIGMIGFSKGGMETYLAAAVDPRVKVAVPCIGVQSFQWALDNDSWQSRAGTFQIALETAAKDEGLAAKPGPEFLKHFYDKVAPGVYSDFDGPAMVPLIAPRALLTINGAIDPRTPMPGLQLCLDAVRKAYQATPDRFRSIIEENTGHKVNPEALEEAVRWFSKWL